MAKFCNKCGSQLRDNARFCNICGHQVRTRRPIPGQADNQNCSVPPISATPTANSVPQFFHSYDFPDSSRPEFSSTAYAPSTPLNRDASRPLPPLSDFFNDDDENTNKRELAEETIMNFSLWAAAIVLVPIPFCDLVLLMPIQSAMVIAVGKAYGVTETPKRILAIIAGSCSASLFGELTALFLSNLIPLIGSLVSAPFIFGWTYGLGEVAARYFESKGQASDSELKSIFKQASKEANNKYDPNRVNSARASLDTLRQYMSEEDYMKIKERFGPEANR
ncbi:MAG: zinc-ribbon domain-containing protein [Candidatus Bruticola sp.]